MAKQMRARMQVFDVNFSADLTIMEEGTELLQRLSKAWEEAEGKNIGTDKPVLPMFTSCCPAWVNMVGGEILLQARVAVCPLYLITCFSAPPNPQMVSCKMFSCAA